ncbi:MAG: RHS repeat-associated core domain-containing protein, partial [Chloroflexota bacterium]
MTSETLGGATTTLTYNSGNELTQASGGINGGFTYDANGNQTSSAAATGLTYNALGQTTSITPSGGSPFGMTYAGSGQDTRL